MTSLIKIFHRKSYEKLNFELTLNNFYFNYF